ncbi:hypothetical protein KEM52_006096 [Ascosphaera acerosa]|nr:hypothetical protein KEM52_006096 [Ascosphaera acerosa]
MGVPKFFRWLSERYPAISQLIAENRIPEFDCLYLDMNGIIHNCTHKDSDSPTFRMTEEMMFISIFNYIEHLFGKIKPKKLFFMAIDGVAPRAKMNQQRARRFRTAYDAEVAKEKAIAQGVEMPKEDPFDSNCITPGTEFMAKLTQQLKYFISRKVSEDTDWQGVEVVLSGHEVPGEGEHKIMEYIRNAKAQPGYDSNVRHCLYGLDADLIMLGLLSHDPHFCLLREEVTFGRQANKKSKELAHQNFHLMHLCMVREYLELEFQELKAQGTLDFEYDFERIIDDFILMAFFVGNDFLPNLPNLHINEGALAWMFKIYKQVLPTLGGYINERGTINMERLGKLLASLSDVEYRFFESEFSGERWINSKQHGASQSPAIAVKAKPREPTMTASQKQVLKDIKQYVADGPKGSYTFPPTLTTEDRKFAERLADDLHLPWSTVPDEDGNRCLMLEAPVTAAADGDQSGSDSDDDEEESQAAIDRVFRRYDKAAMADTSEEERRMAAEAKYDEKFEQWKENYYRDKFGWGMDNAEEMRKLTENYVQGLQWVLYYYYRGVASWPWYYGYHYAPMISDVKLGLQANTQFQLGQPFFPFQQLMGVLPDRSKKIVPAAYHDLMTSPDSPIIDFYPRDFELDMNGKKMEWEAVVKIPFIEEDRLLAAMATRDHLLTDDERKRNSFGVALKFTFDPAVEYTYPSSLLGIFPDIPRCHCVENIFDLPVMDGLQPFVGLVEGVKLGISALAGFPSLRTLSHTGQLGYHGVNIFSQDSRNESMIITLTEPEARSGIELAKQKLGQRVFVGYPYLQEAEIVRVADELFDYTVVEGDRHITTIPHTPPQIDEWRRKAHRIENHYSKRLGIIIGDVEATVHVRMLKGLTKTPNGDTIKEFGDIPNVDSDYALQLVVDSVVSPDERFLERQALPIEEEFPEDSKAFFLGEYNYGCPVHVIGHDKGKVTGRVSAEAREVEIGKQIVREAERVSPYIPAFVVARQLSLNPLTLAKITSSFSVKLGEQRLNLGLNLKFEARKQKVLGYSRRSGNGWEFSAKAIQLIQDYMINFPEFIAGIQRKPQGDMFSATDFYPEDIAATKIREIQGWLKSIESRHLERVPLEAEQLDSDQVRLIEAAIDEHMRTKPPPKIKKLQGVPRNALLKPADAEHRLGNQTFALGDRVIYAQQSGQVPIGTRGTIVGCTRTSRVLLLDVLFDAAFISGTALGDRCSPFRGSTVPATSVLNLSNRQLIAETRESQRRHAAQLQQQRDNGYGGYYGSQAGLKDAPTPAPLSGSWRGAVTGHNATGGTFGMARGRGEHALAIRTRPSPAQSGSPAHQVYPPNGNGSGQVPYGNGRGRGNGSFRGNGRGGFRNGGASKGYASVERTDPDAGVIENNPAFKPRPYNTMPPPPTLDANSPRRGGRGGRGSHRGGNRGGHAQGASTRGSA